MKRAINQTLDAELALELYQVCTKGEIDRVDRVLIEIQQKAHSDKSKEVARLRGYLMENYFGLRDYRLVVNGDGLGGLGTIEGNVDKLVANRMKRRGISWTIEGHKEWPG